MPDDSALRSTLEELKSMQEPIEPLRRSRTDAPGPAPDDEDGGGSLLSDLLSETSGEAQRELEEIKAQLADKKALEEETRRMADLERRKRLDTLREQEARRREDMIRERERKRAEAEAAEARAAAPKPAIEPIAQQAPAKEPQKKKMPGYVWLAVAILLVGGGGVGGWLYLKWQDQERAKVEAAEQASLAEAEKARAAEVAKAQAEADAKKAEADRAASEAEKAKALVAAAATRPDAPVAELPVLVASARAMEREVPMEMYKAGIELKVPRKHTGAGTPAAANGNGKGKIKIKALNLGKGK